MARLDWTIVGVWLLIIGVSCAAWVAFVWLLIRVINALI